jgi:HEAT repeat protein
MCDKKAQPKADQAAVRHYLDIARAGQIESAFFGLIDLDKSVLPILEQEFRLEKDPSVRALIIKAVWNARWPGSIPFVAEALGDPQPQVWKEALDGLVALASPESRAVVESAIALATDPARRVLLQEALEQIQTSIAGP